MASIGDIERGEFGLQVAYLATNVRLILKADVQLEKLDAGVGFEPT